MLRRRRHQKKHDPPPPTPPGMVWREMTLEYALDPWGERVRVMKKTMLIPARLNHLIAKVNIGDATKAEEIECRSIGRALADREWERQLEFEKQQRSEEAKLRKSRPVARKRKVKKRLQSRIPNRHSPGGMA